MWRQPRFCHWIARPMNASCQSSRRADCRKISSGFSCVFFGSGTSRSRWLIAASAACAAGVSAGVVLAVADRREVERDRKDRVDVRSADALETGVRQRGVRVGCEVRARLRVPQQAHQEVEQCRCDVRHDQFPSSSRCESMTDTDAGPHEKPVGSWHLRHRCGSPFHGGPNRGSSGAALGGEGDRVAGADARPA